MDHTEKTAAPFLVSASWLAEHLEDPGIQVIEVAREGEDSSYRAGHIPGAVLWPWKTVLWHETDREFPAPEEMGERLGRFGISSETTVILYGDPVQYATYAFWVLTMCGHPDIRVLDGTRTRWAAEGRPMSKETPRVERVEYRARPGDTSMRVGRDEVRAKLGQPGRMMLDVRTPEEYRGERVSGSSGFDHGAERKGRIPGAVHLFYREILNDDDTLKSPEELRSIFESVGATPEKEIVIYCRLSHRASFVWFAMRYILGYESARIYDGSWTEWGSIVSFPIEK
ncbi:sulfurtransferase [Nitrospinota bacterium]